MLVGERLSRRDRPAEEEPGVQPSVIEALELAGQVKRVLVAAIGFADGDRDAGFPSTDRGGIERIDLTLQVAGVAIGGEVARAWANEASVVVRYAVGGAPHDHVFSELVGQDVVEAPDRWREIPAAAHDVGQCGDAVGARGEVGRPFRVIVQSDRDAGEPWQWSRIGCLQGVRQRLARASGARHR